MTEPMRVATRSRRRHDCPLRTRSLQIVLLTAVAACSSDPSSGLEPDGGGASRGDGSGGGATAGGSSAGTGGGAPAPFGEEQRGEGTYYDANGSGNCSFDPSPGDLAVAAMNTPQYAGSAVCGQCATVSGPKGKVTVRIVDRCPECKAGDLDLSVQAFDKIAERSAGRVPITWRVVSCGVTGNLAYRFKEGSSQWWTAIQVRNHRWPIAKLELKKGAAWVDVAREPYNYFVDASGAGAGAVTVRVTSQDGQVLEDTLPGVADGAVVQGAAQFK